MIHVFESMGTVVTLEPPLRPAEVEAIFVDFDERFSLYKASSELSRIADGSLDLTESSTLVRDAYSLALDWRSLTNGAFTPHRPDGVVDLSGIVKALAMQSVGRMLGDDGHWILNAGGDVLTSGAANVGIVDPSDRSQLLTSVALADGRRAVATSGSSERGDHIWGRGGFVQVTVVADDIVTADVLATTIAAGGIVSLNDSTARWDIDVLAVDSGGNLLATPRMRTLISNAEASAHQA